MSAGGVRARLALGTLLVGSVLVLAGCSSSVQNATAGAVTSAASPPPAPLDASLSTPAGDLVVLPMGRLGDPLNTFWQLFFRAPGASSWSLVTPPGVADNGGLVASVTPRSSSGGASLLTGFEPSQALVFSPLALSADDGRGWSPGLLPGPLAAVPDALALASGGNAFALRRGGVVLRTVGSDSTWAPIARRSSLASSAASRSCGLVSLSALATTAAGQPLVGASCSKRAVVGIFALRNGHWLLAGPVRPALPGAGAATVLRLVDASGVPTALVAASHGRGTVVFALAARSDGSWARSVPLALGVGARVASTGVAPDGAFVVQTTAPGGGRGLDVEQAPAGPWSELPAPPPGTEAVTSGPGGVDALTVHSTAFADWRLDPSTGRWEETASVTVPIEFGSSS